MAEQGEHQGHDVHGRPQAIEGCAHSRSKSPATGGASIALLLLTMDSDVPLSHLPSGGAVRVVTELTLRVHRASPPDAVWRFHLEGCTLDPYVSNCELPHHG
jgi:hypothetical protein